MNSTEMGSTARASVAPGKGILAADERMGTIEKRFKPLGISSTEQTRVAYHDMLFKTPNLGQFMSAWKGD